MYSIFSYHLSISSIVITNETKWGIVAGAEYTPDLGDERLDGYIGQTIAAELPVEVVPLEVPRKWLRRAVGTVALIGLMAGGIEALPNAPGHVQAALAIRMAEADVHAALTSRSREPTYQNLISNYSVGNGLFRGNNNALNLEYATVWPVSRVLDAEYIHALNTGDSQDFIRFEDDLHATAENYLDTPAPGLPQVYDQGPREFHLSGDAPLVDDSEWMARLNMLDYEHTHDPAQLRIAKGIFAAAMTQWDKKSGGIFWQMQVQDATTYHRAMVSNATVARLGFELYAQTNNPYYLQASKRVEYWVNSTLKLGSGRYADHIDTNGSVDKDKFTYNYALQPLAEAEESPVFVPDAAMQLESAVRYFKHQHLAGNPAFDSIFAESALWVAGRYNHPEFTAQIKEFIGDAIAAEPKNPTNILTFSSEVVLHELQRLPAAKYKYLFA